MTKGWHGESKRHSDAAKGIKTKNPEIEYRQPETPIVRIDVEDQIENVSGTGRVPLWLTLGDMYIEDQNTFNKLLSRFGWMHVEDPEDNEEIVDSFMNKSSNKTITIDLDNRVTIFDHSFFGEEADYSHAENFYHVEEFENYEGAFFYALQQVAADMKERDKTGNFA